MAQKKKKSKSGRKPVADKKVRVFVRQSLVDYCNNSRLFGSVDAAIEYLKNGLPE